MPSKQPAKRAKITAAAEAQIINQIDHWPANEPLSREGLTRWVNGTLGLPVSRQGIMKRRHIADAFDRREAEIRGDRPARSDREPLTAELESRIERLTAELEREKETVERYKRLFVTYRYNANRLGFSRERLEAPIPVRNQRETSAD